MSAEQFQRFRREIESRRDELRPSDLTGLSEQLRAALNFATRVGRISLSDLAQKLELTNEEALEIAQLLVERKLLYVSAFLYKDETMFETRLSSMTRPLGRPPSALWKKIEK